MKLDDRYQTQTVREMIREARSVRLKSFLGLILCALVIAWSFMPLSAQSIEKLYSQGFYPQLSRFLVPLSEQVPLNLSLMLLLFILLMNVLALFRRLRQRRLGLWLSHLLLTLGILGISFMLFWGTNYKRQSLSSHLKLDEAAISSQELDSLAEALLGILHREANTSRDVDSALAANRLAMERLLRELNLQDIPQLPQSVKEVPSGLLLRFANSSGVMMPWLLEANVDAALPVASFVHVASHELAHSAGFAPEADAELLASLAGFNSGNGFARYAAALASFQDVSAALSEAKREKYLAELPSIAKDDWNALIAISQKYAAPPWLASTQRQLYDGYLRSQGVSNGIANYSDSLKLLVAAKRQNWLDLE
ncbi:MAG: DUF3810 family protein [Deinococcales bacterium]